MIRLERVTKGFKSGRTTHYVVRDVSYTIERGQSIGLLGRNGAGKSTLLRLIAGIIQPDKGRVRREAKVSWPLGFAGSFAGSLTGEQNVRFVARIYGVDTEELTEYVEEFAELGDQFRKPVSGYSSGMKARLAFGISMGIQFDYYLIDETLAVGDVNFKRKCQEVFTDKLSNSDVIMVSHQTSAIRNYCDRALVLEDGKLTFFENIEEAIEFHNRTLSIR
ncbi:ABC transporter ATP-binding protein [Rhizobiales bacterium]|uniref:ABC transporter ATP-binding protein n=1 Tax=Hongsoonwoonella zoysiae TaxID=2821844 RepID=UPI0015601AAC|nr:ABC transporter ATP-binding protein [Hongsoonwoonella zoysiae]NRG18544.1 ABC transporter ATP-binding protein [Hongsoonwoonella zoysiae]